MLLQANRPDFSVRSLYMEKSAENPENAFCEFSHIYIYGKSGRSFLPLRRILLPGGFGHAPGMLIADLMIPAGREYCFPLNGKQTGRPYGRKNFWDRFSDLGFERREILSRNTNWKDERGNAGKAKVNTQMVQFLSGPSGQKEVSKEQRTAPAAEKRILF